MQYSKGFIKYYKTFSIEYYKIYKILDKHKKGLMRVKCEEVCVNNWPPKDYEVLFITIINKVISYSLGDRLFMHAS